MKCRICGNDMTEEQIVPVKDDLTDIISSLPRSYIERKMPLFYCQRCQHRQIDYVMNDQFYEGHASNQEGIEVYYGDLDNKKKYVNTLRKYVSTGSILDVGCGQGEFLGAASKYFDTCCGIEPHLYKKRTQADNIKYMNGYFNKKLTMQKYDSIVSFNVLEHVEDVIGFVEAYYKFLNDDGVGIINVPNGSEPFIAPNFSQIVMQHINYFSVYSLMTLLNDNGFELLEIENDIAALEITVYFRKKKQCKNIFSCINNLKCSLNDELNGYKKVAIWGAGLRSASYASLLEKKNKEKISHIFDNNENKHGGYIGGLNISIQKPNVSLIKKMEVIVIFASAYNSEIIKDLTEMYNYKGKIVYIENDKICIHNL